MRALIFALMIGFSSAFNDQASKELSSSRGALATKRSRGVSSAPGLLPASQARSRNDASSIPTITLVKKLEALQEFRKGRWHWPVLDATTDPEESQHITLIESHFVKARKQAVFIEEEETFRMIAIDYLGEKLKGRLSTQYAKRISEILDKHSFEISQLSPHFFEKRQWQSLTGDRQDIVRYVEAGI